MEPIYIASFASFLIGLFGYIIIRFWIIPISRYTKIKRRLASDMRALPDMLPDEHPPNHDSQELQTLGLSIRRLCADLVSIYQNDLPYWYRLYLESKTEQPQEAADLSMRLANTRNREHALQQADEIKRHLRLK